LCSPAAAPTSSKPVAEFGGHTRIVAAKGQFSPTRPNCVSGFATAGRTIRPQTTQGERTMSTIYWFDKGYVRVWRKGRKMRTFINLFNGHGERELMPA
jgi:hypothetical protein